MLLNPENDGVDHINAYSRSESKLGQWLSNFAQEEIDIEEDGTFQSIEGYWYWLGDQKNTKLRRAYGYQAKKMGRSKGIKKLIPKKEFRRKIKKAFRLKINANKKMKKRFIKSLLPIVHYYVESCPIKGDRLIMIPKHNWFFKYMNDYRDKLQEKRGMFKIEDPDYSISCDEHLCADDTPF